MLNSAELINVKMLTIKSRTININEQDTCKLHALLKELNMKLLLILILTLGVRLIITYQNHSPVLWDFPILFRVFQHHVGSHTNNASLYTVVFQRHRRCYILV